MSRRRRRLVKLTGGKAELGLEARRWCGQSREKRIRMLYVRTVVEKE